MPLFIANPSKRRRRRKMKANPTRRRRRATRKNPVRRKRRMKSNPIFRTRRRHKRRMRRNPIARRRRGLSAKKGKLSIMGTVTPALSAAAGAIATDIVFARLPLDEKYKAGVMQQIVKAGVGLGLGWIVSKYVDRRIGAAIATGGIAIAAYEAGRSRLSAAVPSLGLGEYLDGLGYYNAGMPMAGFGEYIDDGSEAVNPNSGMLTLADYGFEGSSFGAFSESTVF